MSRTTAPVGKKTGYAHEFSSCLKSAREYIKNVNHSGKQIEESHNAFYQQFKTAITEHEIGYVVSQSRTVGIFFFKKTTHFSHV